MSTEIFEVLEDFAIRISGKRKFYKVGQKLYINTNKKNNCDPKIDRLKNEKKIKEVASKKEETQTTSKENVALVEKVSTQKKQMWTMFGGKSSDMESTKPNTPTIHDEKLHDLNNIDPIRQLINAEYEKVNKNIEGFRLDNQNLKLELADLNVSDEVAKITNDVADIKHSLNSNNEDIKKVLYENQQIRGNIHEKYQLIERNLVSIPSTVKREMEHTTRKIKEDQGNVLSSLKQVSGKLSQQTAEIQTAITEIDEKLQSSTRGLKRNVEETKEAVEALQGKANVLEDLKNKLDKVIISEKLSPFNHEDDVVLELFEQGQLIMEQLMLASRHYVAQRHNVKQLEAENAKLKQEQDQITESTAKATELRIKGEITRQMTIKIAEAFNNLDDVYEEGKLIGLRALLDNNGLERDDAYKAGTLIEITDDTRESLEAKIDFVYKGEGQYRIDQSCFMWKDTKRAFKKAHARKSEEPELINEKIASTEELIIE